MSSSVPAVACAATVAAEDATAGGPVATVSMISQTATTMPTTSVVSTAPVSVGFRPSKLARLRIDVRLVADAQLDRVDVE